MKEGLLLRMGRKDAMTIRSRKWLAHMMECH